MFKKILIANRGEIACRIIHTARKMGIATVAVYSDADRAAKHVQLADEAIPLGGMTAQDSYLQADKIIAACHKTGAQAVHRAMAFCPNKPVSQLRLKKLILPLLGRQPMRLRQWATRLNLKSWPRQLVLAPSLVISG